MAIKHIPVFWNIHLIVKKEIICALRATRQIFRNNHAFKWDFLWNTKKSDDWILWGQSGVRVVANIWDNFTVWLLNYWVDSLFPDFIRVSVFYFQIFNIWSSWAQFSSQIQFCCLGVAKLLSQFIYFFKLSCLQEFWYVLLILAGAQCVSHSFIFFLPAH